LAEVAIVILNWNGKPFLEKFLPSVVKYSIDKAKIIIADNDSKDDSIEFLTKNYPQIPIIRSNENKGFAEGYNFALSQVNADYYILLNSDIEVTENWISPVIDMMENDRNIAACQPKLLSYYDRERFEYAGAAGGFIDKFGYPFCRGRLFQSLEKDEGQYDDEKEIFWATGACMFVRAELFHKAGEFDRDFFAHMEEIDLCWRLRNAGYKIMFCPGSTVYHVGGGTLPKISSVKTYLNFRNNIILYYKNLPMDALIYVFIIRMLLDGLAAFKFLFEGHYRDFVAVLKAHFYFYKTYPRQREKRKKIPHIRDRKLIYRLSIAMDYYLRGKRKFSELKF
jgi:GT2 family glycosyltransferase